MSASANPLPPDLILGVTTVMAATAMDAYHGPLNGQEFQNHGPNGTRTQYLDTGFVVGKLGALLEVTVNSANGVWEIHRSWRNFFGQPALFVEVSAGGSYGKTTETPGKADLEFNETLLLWPRHSAGGVIASGPPVLTVSVRVTDDGQGKLGCGTLPLSADWESMPPQDTEVEIVSEGEVKGRVTLTLKPSKIQPGDEGSEAGARAYREIAHTVLGMPEDAPEELQANVAAATVLAPPLAQLSAATPVTNFVDAPTDANTAAAARAASAALAKLGLSPGLDDTNSDLASIVGAGAFVKAGAAQEGAGDLTEKQLNELWKKTAREKVMEAWLKLPAVFPGAFLFGGAPVAYLVADSDTHAYLHCNSDKKQVVISFRGTTSNRNWLTNAEVALNVVAHDPDTNALRTISTSGQRDSDWRARLGPVGPLMRESIHRGFYLGYRSVQPQIREVLAMITGGDASWSVTTTGHSLGGALAVLCAYDLAVSTDLPYPVSCYTYGCPRVGNDHFIEDFKAQVPGNYRMHNHNDLVPQVPWALGYDHPPSEIRIDYDKGGDNHLYMPQENAISVFGDRLESGKVHFVSDEVMQKLKSEQGPRAGWGRWLRTRAGVIGALFSREGVASHATELRMQSEYTETLADVMLLASSEERDVEAVQAVRDALAALRQVYESIKRKEHHQH